MPTTLYAACGDKSDLQVRHIPIARGVQRQVGKIFQEQKENFLRGVDSEVSFIGRAYSPASDELLTIPVPDRAKCFVDAVAVSPIAVEGFDIKRSLTEQNVRALFVNSSSNGTSSVLVQRFLTGQVLSQRKLAFMLSGGTFAQLDTDVFSLGNKLVCIIQDELIKFKSMYALRSIMDMGPIYREATYEDVRKFAKDPKFFVSDEDEFVQVANEPIRKLITGIVHEEILKDFSVEEIQKAAASTKLDIEVKDGKIVLPMDKKDLKSVLEFLDESRYTGLLSGNVYATNNRRLVG